MKILVTGSNGNIGAHIVRELLRQTQGHEIIGYGRQPVSIHPSSVRYIRGDRSDTKQFIEVMKQLRPDIVFEMTSFTPQHAKAGLEAFAGVKQLIVASTVCTYGKDFTRYPLEESDPYSPWTDYGIQKQKADEAYLEAWKKDGFPVTIMKPCTSFSGMSGVLRSFATEHTWIDRVLKDKPILICADGNILHQYMHTKDTANAFVSVMDNAACLGQIYNIAPDGYTTWRQFHQAAMDVLGHQVELIPLSLTHMMSIDPDRFVLAYEIFGQHTYVSNQKLKRHVPNWRPEISLEDSLEMSFRGMKERGTIPDSSSSTWEDDIIAKVLAFRESFRR
jgi:nucleoside-diphosphate-sugar epimerase